MVGECEAQKYYLSINIMWPLVFNFMHLLLYASMQYFCYGLIHICRNKCWRTYGRRLSLELNEQGKFMQAHLLRVSNHDAAKRRKWVQRCVQKMLVPHMHRSYLHTLVIATAIVVIGQILQNLTLRNCFWKGLGDCPGDSGRFLGDSSPTPWPPGLGGHDIYSPYHKNISESYVINDVVHTHSILLLWTCTLMYKIKSCCIHNLAGNPELATQVSTNPKSSHLSASAVSIPWAPRLSTAAIRYGVFRCPLPNGKGYTANSVRRCAKARGWALVGLLLRSPCTRAAPCVYSQDQYVLLYYEEIIVLHKKNVIIYTQKRIIYIYMYV